MKYDAIILTDTKELYRIRPLGAYVIANSLRQAGYSCLVIDHFTDMKKEKLFHFLESFIGENTVFVGYSSSLLFSINDGKFQYLGVDLDYFVEINQHIKQINNKTKIVFGGAYTPKFSEFTLKSKKNLGVDYLIHGYSEGMIVEFMKNQRAGRSQKFSKKNYGLYEIDYDFKGDSFNFCDENFGWHDDDFIFEGEALPIELSRGCIFKCKFCAYPLLGKNKNDFTYLKTEENILSEILSNYERFKTLNYQIIDDTFNERTEKLEMLLKVRDKSKLNLSFVGFNRLDLIHRFPEQISLFKDLNFVGHAFGIETFNYESSKIIGKGLKESDATETLFKIKNSMNCVNTSAGFILGLPKENMKTFYDWFMRVADKDYPLDTIVLNALWLSETTHTKSEFFSNPSKYGYSFVERDITENYSGKIWKNEYWSFDECQRMAHSILFSLRENGRNKISSFRSLGLSSLTENKDLMSVLNVPLKDVTFDFFRKKHWERIEKYIDRLESLC
jgi:radical SAM superfamily enzyme YgiQ (UPF0313 family)